MGRKIYLYWFISEVKFEMNCSLTLLGIKKVLL